ncbi:MAG: 3'-5' exonuclease [Treponema sp.]|jgi:DNA polymerase-3 subunit epsilon|nr:3'-5' exonuclease [Treponema sp.]
MNDFIAIDFETAMYKPNSAISIGLVRYRGYQPVETYYSLIRPPSLYIRPDFTDIHGLTIDDVIDKPDFGYLWENGIRDFLGDTPLAAHNAAFDMGVLRAVLEWYELPVPELRYFCTCRLARRTWPGFKSYALTALAARFDIAYNAHNALDDAMTCGKLVQMSAQEFNTGPDIEKLLQASETRLDILTRP